MPLPRCRRALLATAAAAGAIVLTATAASAHVEVSSPNAETGADEATLVFTVPNESDSAATTALTVRFPTDLPYAEVAPRAIDGWTVREHTSTLDPPVSVGGFTLSKAVTSVTWTAARGGGIPVGEFDEFELSVGPMPDAATTLGFPVTQTYADGQVVDWTQPPEADGSEPEHPMPALELTAAAGADSGDADAADTGELSSTDSTARALGVGGLVLGAVGAVLGALAWRNSRSRP